MRFHGHWQNYVKATKINRKEAVRQAAMFFLPASNVMLMTSTQRWNLKAKTIREKPDKLIEVLERHCVGEV
jgi:hypothetical protein